MSSLLEQASVIITPNAYKEGKLYGLKGTDLDVVRATTATRVNAEGLIEEVPYNLLQRSEEFDNASWVKNRITETPNAITAPNGTLTADLLDTNANGSGSSVTQNITSVLGTRYNISVFVKRNNTDFLLFNIVNNAFTNGVRIWFNINTKTISSTLNVGFGLSVSNTLIEEYADDWLRLSTSVVADDGLIRTAFFITNANGVFSSTIGDKVFIWGAQLVQGTEAKEYLRTETRLNIPRLDYTNGSCPSILVEPQRTNLLLRSEEFDNASWIKTNTTVTANAIISPDGNTTADKLVEDTSTANHLITQAAGGSGVQTYAISVFAKSFSADRFLQIWVGNTINAAAWIRLDLDNGTITQNNGIAGTGYSIASFSIQDFGNGWYKCVLVANKLNTTGTNTIQFRLSQISTGAESNSYLGNGTSGLYLWGAQLEVGSYATSYIPTVASAVTRNADVISKTGIADLIGQSEGTLFVDAKVSNNNSDNVFALHQNTVNDNRILILLNSLNNTVLFFLAKNNITQIIETFSVSNITSGFQKIAFVYKENQSAFFINGTKVGVDLSCETFAENTLSRLSLFNPTGTAPFRGNVNSIQVYKTALTDQECINLTTL